MAKLVFLIEDLPPSQEFIVNKNFELIEQLAESQHEIKVLTTFRADKEHHSFSSPRIEVLYPFKKWNSFEVMRVLPLLYRFQPDIIHHMDPYSHVRPSLFDGRPVLALSTQTALSSRYVVSDFSFNALKQSGVNKKSLYQSANLILLGNNHQQNFVETMPTISAKNRVHSLALHHSTPTMTTKQPFWASQQFSNYILVSGPVSSLLSNRNSLKRLMNIQAQVPGLGVVVGGWGDVSIKQRKQFLSDLADTELLSHWLIAEPEDWAERLDLIDRATLLWSAHLPITQVDWLWQLPYALYFNTRPVLTEVQADMTGYQWQKGEHYLLDAEQDVITSLKQPDVKCELKQVLQQVESSYEANQLNRLYSSLV